MANTKIRIEKITFDFTDEDFTGMEIFYSSDEPGNPFYGGGTKVNKFSSKMSASDIIQSKEFKKLNWLSWPDK